MTRFSAIRAFGASFALLLAALFGSAPVLAQSNEEIGFQAYLQLLSARARAEGISESTIANVTQGLTFNPRVIVLDRSQPGSTPSTVPSFEPYRRRHVDPVRIAGGRKIMAEDGDLIRGIEQRYGVPAGILLGIWGHESNYGRVTGDFDLARSLATLAYEGRRQQLFADEFIALLRMIDRGVPSSKLVGSWAGAFGNPQFLPSVYLRVAQDADGNGLADIWSSRPDTLASIANYFRDAGWRTGQPWGVAVSLPADFDRANMRTGLISPRCPQVFTRHSRWRSMAEWRALGAVAVNGDWPADDVQATLLEPDGPGKIGWLLTGNYRVILDYNCSNFYALSVGLLSDEISR